MATPIKLRIKKLDNRATLPTRGTAQSAGFDLYSIKKQTVNGNSIITVNTGLSFEIPEGYVGIIKERSGFTFQNRVIVKGGVIDSDYRGEIKIIIENVSDYPIIIDAGTSVAQILILELPSVILVDVDADEELSDTERGTAGFGSTNPSVGLIKAPDPVEWIDVVIPNTPPMIAINIKDNKEVKMNGRKPRNTK
jgi:dUTP pyrophosphatase